MAKRGRPGYSEEKKQEIVNMFLTTDLKPSEMEEYINIPASTIHKILVKEGVYYRKPNKKWTEEQKENKKTKVDLEIVEDLRNKNYTFEEIAKYLNISESTLSLRIKESGLDLPNIIKPESARKNEDLIVSMYNLGYCMAEIGRKLECCDTVIKKVLLKHNVQVSDTRKYRITNEELIQSYKELGSYSKVANHFSVSEFFVSNRISKIPEIISIKNSRKSENAIILSDKEIEILEGELLGDGYILQKNIFGFTNTKKDYVEYLQSNLSILHNRNIHTSPPKPFIGRQGKTYIRSEKYEIRSLSQNSLKYFYKKWYPEGTKIVPRDLILTPITLRHWFYGDGHNCKDNWRIQLCTNGFTLEDVSFLVESLQELGFTNARVKKDNYQGKISYSIKISNKETVTSFIKYISPCNIPSMIYKFKLE